MNGRLTVAEVAGRYGVSRRTVARWCERGRFPSPGAYKIGTGRRGIWVIPPEALVDFAPPRRGG